MLVSGASPLLAQNYLVFAQEAQNRDKANDAREASFFAAKALERTNAKGKITEMKAILRRRFHEYTQQAEAQIAELTAKAISEPGDAKVQNLSQIYKTYKDLVRHHRAAQNIPTEFLEAALSKEDSVLQLSIRDYTAQKTEAKLRLVKARQEASKFYHQQGVAAYATETKEQKLLALDFFEKSLRYQANNEEAKQSQAIVKAQLAIMYLKEAEVLLKKPGVEAAEKAIETLSTAFGYAPQEDQKDIILLQLDNAQRYLREQQATPIFAEALQLAANDSIPVKLRALEKFREVESILPDFKDNATRILTLESQIAQSYLAEAQKNLQSPDAEQERESLQKLVEAYRFAPENPEVKAVYEANQERIKALQNSLVDVRDGQTYRTVQIGNRVWMAENLRYKLEPEAPCYGTDPTWTADLTEKEQFCEKYGILYNSRVLFNQIEDLAPEGWHVATEAEWKALQTSITVTVNKQDESLKSVAVGFVKKLNIQLPTYQSKGKIAQYATATKFTWNNAGGKALRILKITENNYEDIHDGQEAKFVFIRCVKDY
ncbi:MAG: hypothetical protein OHK0053_17940 [Microscillaceae bacterium]